MKKIEIPKAYNSDTEMEMYKLWEKSGCFNPDKIKTQKKPFVISLPPPNANGELHVGHTCGYSFQDCMGRYNRMKGHPTLLLPGKDHAGIQTEAVFTKILAKKGIKKRDIGREEFYKKAYEFCIKNAEHAREQEKRIGLSADWSREKFTLDPALTEIVYKTFFQMLDEKLIYRGAYIINQCTYCGTALANADTEHILKKGVLVYIRYPVSESGVGFVTVATTRPETMLGDTAVAVNPKDKKYKNLIGTIVNLPLTDRQIPIIADNAVDKDFGTGALKVTPAHSVIDFEIGERHKLKILNVINGYGRMNENVPKKYEGMKVKECRESVIEDLEKLDLVEKIEDIEHEVVVCERCKHDIEQIVSKQWFVNVKPLAASAVKALDSGETKVIPVHQHKVLKSWLENIRPWCISRQLWWGQRIPVWYCGGKELYDWLIDHPTKTKKDYEKITGSKVEGCGVLIPGDKSPVKCPKCKSKNLEAEQDCFDTWFSSGQWPFTTVGSIDSEEFDRFYPTDVMETARDILFWWVARMMMLGIYMTGKTPFHHVYLHGMILATDGQKMSKARGNGVEPTDVFDRFGADALRLWYFTDTLPGQNTPIREEKLKGNRNFVNKVWNASRYVMIQIQNLEEKEIQNLENVISGRISGLSSTTDEWEISTNELAKKVTDHLDLYRFNLAVEGLREFFWHTFCDKWIEETKNLISGNEDKKSEYLGRLVAILCVQLKLMHPFAPFVTENIWQNLRSLGLLTDENELLMVSKWP